MKRFASPRALAAALVTALALSLGLAAGTSLASPRGHHGLEADGSMFHAPGLERLHDELKLDARQEALWKNARDFIREQRGTARERFGKEHAEIRAMLDQPGVDLRAVVKRMDELRDEGGKQRQAAREHCLAVYDALDAGQKEKVRAFFLKGMERRGHFGSRGGEREGHRRRAP